MPTIAIFYGVVIQMFWREHNPPHFHAVYAGEEAIIDIRTLQVVEGAISRRALAMVLDWAEAHRDALLENWRLCQLKQHPNKIEPLA